MRFHKFFAPLLFFSLFISNPLRAERILRVCDDVEQPISLNPYRVFSEKVITLMQQMMESLVRFDSAGQIEPSLAERWERINDTTMRFYLRKGVLFHNGEPLDAKSVKFSVEKYVNPETKYLGYGFLSTISHVNIIDDHTVDVITHIPDGLLLNRMAAFSLITPVEYYTQAGDDQFSQHPIGTGPFKFEKWVNGKEIVLSANPHYWMKNIPKVDSLIFKFVPWETQVSELLKGGLDLVTELPGTRTFEVMKNPKTKVIKKETLYVIACSLNASSGHLKDKRLRQAINYALNREEMIRYDVLGNGKALAGIAMRGEEGYDPGLKPYPYDPQKARELLKEAGYPNGLKLTMIAKEQGSRTAGIIQRQFKQVGIELEIHYATDANVIDVVASKPWDLYIGGCPDPMVHSFFVKAVVLYSKSPHSIYRNPEFDHLLEEMVRTLDQKERVKKAQDLERFVHEEALSLFMYQRIKTYGASRTVQFNPSTTGMPHFFPVVKNNPINVSKN